MPGADRLEHVRDGTDWAGKMPGGEPEPDLGALLSSLGVGSTEHSSERAGTEGSGGDDPLFGMLSSMAAQFDDEDGAIAEQMAELRQALGTRDSLVSSYRSSSHSVVAGEGAPSPALALSLACYCSAVACAASRYGFRWYSLSRPDPQDPATNTGGRSWCVVKSYYWRLALHS